MFLVKQRVFQLFDFLRRYSFYGLMNRLVKILCYNHSLIGIKLIKGVQ
ncbi:hypothetical protein HPSA20_0134 [Helicobacter pylori SouthAfrica20]|uniref:Uncharacterized protein n=1 Tax=Helicobacter pylori SouthAfrica20 TaxID=1352356 RepID=T1U8X4_HELPX|nr:hypothetical protein HPSA20_0134 [Helicobacter pylori SouthAfrica20]